MKNKKLIAIIFSFMLVSISVVAYAQATSGSDVMTKRKLNPTQKSTQTKNNPTPQTGNKILPMYKQKPTMPVRNLLKKTM